MRSHETDEEQRKLWDISAEAYKAHVDRFNSHARITALLLSLVSKEPKSILDFGCGPGNSTLLLSRMYPNARIYGVDSSSRMIEIAKSANDRPVVSYHHCEVDQIAGNILEKIDLIVCSNSFFHVTNKSALLAYFHSMLSDEAEVVFSMYDFLYRPRSAVQFGSQTDGDDELMSSLVDSLRRAGFSLEDRTEDREIFTEESLSTLFSAHSFSVELAAVLRFLRTARERISFFALPVVAKENFPTLPVEAMQNALNEIEHASSGYPTRMRYVYGFKARPVREPR